MAGSFSRWRLTLSAVLVAVLPYVSPIDYNTCNGGGVAQTCRNQYISHCCKSGAYLSATCCWNACTYSASGAGWMSMHCSDITNSMCCSKTKYGSQSCCNRESYSRTSSSSVNGDYLKPTYGTCSGYSEGTSLTAYCTNSLTTECCSPGFLYTTYGRGPLCCPKPPTCVGTYGYTDTCSRSTSTYCCSLSQTCCDAAAYSYEAENSGHSAGAIGGGVFGGIALLIFIIVVPVVVVCCAPKGRGPDAAGDTAGTSVDAEASNSQSNADNPEKPIPDVVPVDQPQPLPEPEEIQVEQPLSSSVSSALNQ